MELKQVKAEADAKARAVLIVPYGIETLQNDLPGRDVNGVNCTLWN